MCQINIYSVFILAQMLCWGWGSTILPQSAVGITCMFLMETLFTHLW